MAPAAASYSVYFGQVYANGNEASWETHACKALSLVFGIVMALCCIIHYRTRCTQPSMPSLCSWCRVVPLSTACFTLAACPHRPVVQP